MRKRSGTGWNSRTHRLGGTATANAHTLLVGALSHSSKWRGVLCESMEQPQLADAQYQVATKLGGVTKDWRFDRMATVVHPGSGAVTATYAQIAKHFGVRVRLCPPRRGNRKGIVEKANHTAAQRWWRSLPDEVTAAAAQASLDEFCQQVTDQRTRLDQHGNRCTVADLAAAEPLRPVPKDPPIAVITVTRKVSAQPLVSFRGNTYSVPPAHVGQQVSVTHRLGAATIGITTAGGVTVAVPPPPPDGAGAVVRAEADVTALNTAALAAFTTAAPHRSNGGSHLGPAARDAAAVLLAPYVAGPAGFGLARTLATAGGAVCGVSPSKLQRPAGDRAKTDRDAERLATLRRKNHVVAVRVPSADEQTARTWSRLGKTHKAISCAPGTDCRTTSRHRVVRWRGVDGSARTVACFRSLLTPRASAATDYELTAECQN